MKKILITALSLVLHQGAWASDAFDMDLEIRNAVARLAREEFEKLSRVSLQEALIDKVRSQCGNPGEFDQYHAELMHSIPLNILQTLVDQGSYINSLHEGPGLRNKVKQARYGHSGNAIHLEVENGGYDYHHCARSVVSHLTQYTHFVLGLRDKHLAFVPSELRSLGHLTTLDLADNNLSALPGSIISNLKCLETMSLEVNSICYLPPEIGMLTRLKCLSLRDNPFVELPETFINLISLEKLYLSTSQIASNQELLLSLQYNQYALGKTPVDIFADLDNEPIDLSALNLVGLSLPNFGRESIGPRGVAVRVQRDGIGE